MPALVQVPTTPTPCQGLYANISILEHSCINNASKHFDGDNRVVIRYCTVLNCTVLYCTVLYCTVLYCTVVIRAAINIKKGEHISINYSDPMWGTANRQLHLGQSLTNTMNIM